LADGNIGAGAGPDKKYRFLLKKNINFIKEKP